MLCKLVFHINSNWVLSTCCIFWPGFWHVHLLDMDMERSHVSRSNVFSVCPFWMQIVFLTVWGSNIDNSKLNFSKLWHENNNSFMDLSLISQCPKSKNLNGHILVNCNALPIIFVPRRIRLIQFFSSTKGSDHLAHS